MAVIRTPKYKLKHLIAHYINFGQIQLATTLAYALDNHDAVQESQEHKTFYETKARNIAKSLEISE